MDEIFKNTKDKMQNALEALKKDFNSVSTGRATPNLLDTVRVEVYGNQTPIYQIANISIPDPSSISIQPWDKSTINPISKAITEANLGFNPIIDGSIIRINIPKLTEERRKEFVKLIKKYSEDKKISIRNDRREALDEAKKNKTSISEDDLKKFNEKIQKLTDEYIDNIDSLLEEKEKQIMKV